MSTGTAMTITLKKRELIASNTLQVTFGLAGGNIEFTPGQYASITLPDIVSPDQRGNQRFFSITTLPGNADFSIATRLSDSSYKQTLADLPLGSQVNLDMVAGSFVLPDIPSQPIVFIAGGIGITPFISMLRHVARQKTAYDITLLYSNRDQQSAAFLDELYTFSEAITHFHLAATMTKDPSWAGPASLIDGPFIKNHVAAWQDAAYYAAGPPQMVNQMLSTLQAMGIAEDAIRYEQFAGYTQTAHEAA